MRHTKTTNGGGAVGSKKIVLFATALLSLYIVSVALVAAPLARQPLATVKGALDAWEHEDWTKMYDFMSSADKEKTSITAFVAKRRTLAVIEHLTGYKILKVTAIDHNNVIVKVELVMRRGRYTTFLTSKTSHLNTVVTKWHLINEGREGWKITFQHERRGNG